MDGKVIVVTGALGALGRVVVDEALARGARIASVDHAPTQVPATADLFELGGVDNFYVHYKRSNDGVTWTGDLGTRISTDQQGGPGAVSMSNGRVIVTSNTMAVSYWPRPMLTRKPSPRLEPTNSPTTAPTTDKVYDFPR